MTEARLEGVSVSYGTFENGEKGTQLLVAVSGGNYDQANPIQVATQIACLLLAHANTLSISEGQADGDNGSTVDEFLRDLDNGPTH